MAVWIPQNDIQSYKRGMRMEVKAFNALYRYPTPWWIVAVLGVDPYSELDHQGIDLLVFTKYGDEPVPLQIKSSKMGAEDHWSKHPEIPCVVVSPNDSVYKVRKRLVRTISSFINKKISKMPL